MPFGGTGPARGAFPKCYPASTFLLKNPSLVPLALRIKIQSPAPSLFTSPSSLPMIPLFMSRGEGELSIIPARKSKEGKCHVGEERGRGEGMQRGTFLHFTTFKGNYIYETDIIFQKQIVIETISAPTSVTLVLVSICDPPLFFPPLSPSLILIQCVQHQPPDQAPRRAVEKMRKTQILPSG